MAESGSLWHTNAKYVHASFPADICLPHKSTSENIGEAGSGNEVQDLSLLYQQEMKEPHDPATCKARLPTHSCNILNRMKNPHVVIVARFVPGVALGI